MLSISEKRLGKTKKNEGVKSSKIAKISKGVKNKKDAMNKEDMKNSSVAKNDDGRKSSKGVRNNGENTLIIKTITLKTAQIVQSLTILPGVTISKH